MAVNPKLHRWVHASIADRLLSSPVLPSVVESLAERTPSFMQETHRAEFTISGPTTKQISAGLYRVTVLVTGIISSTRSDNDLDHLTHVGGVANRLDACLIVRDYGDTGLVDVMELSPDSDNNQAIEVVNFKPTTLDREFSSTVTARYVGYFSE